MNKNMAETFGKIMDDLKDSGMTYEQISVLMKYQKKIKRLRKEGKELGLSREIIDYLFSRDYIEDYKSYTSHMAKLKGLDKPDLNEIEKIIAEYYSISYELRFIKERTTNEKSKLNK